MTPQELEQFIDRQLRSLPRRPAPRGLHARVMASVRQQAALPWHRRSWSAWPALVRVPLLTLAVAAVAVTVSLLGLAVAGVPVGEAAAQVGAWLGLLGRLYGAWRWGTDFVANAVDGLPPILVFVGRSLVLAVCATFFGLCAVSYRMLYRNNWKTITHEI